MKRFNGLLAVFAFSLLVMGLPMAVSAQWGGNNRDRDRDRDDNYGRNNGYNDYAQLKSTVRRLRNDSKDLAKFIDRDFDRRRYDDRGLEDQVNHLANDFKRAAGRLDGRFDSRDLYKSSREAQEVVNLANQLDRELRRARLGWDVQNYWNNVQRQVREISNAYNYNRGRGNNQNGGWGDWRNRFPF